MTYTFTQEKYCAILAASVPRHCRSPAIIWSYDYENALETDKESRPLRRSPIIILDEATASVDVHTEKQIQKAISALTGKQTIIAIAHRLSTIQGADQILVFHEGEIAERGSHEELLEKKGLYFKLHQAQSLEED